MSADTLHTPAHGHDDHAHGDHAHGEHAHGEAPHGTLRSYLIGFILSVILTAIPFGLVMTGHLDTTTTAVIVLAMAAIQVVVHMVFFLHMTTTAEGGWSFLALLFTVIVIVITLSGSIWVMYHMNANMMPMSSPAAAEALSQ